jgi:hypothetical protein
MAARGRGPTPLLSRPYRAFEHSTNHAPPHVDCRHRREEFNDEPVHRPQGPFDFDIIICLEVVEHSPDPLRIFRDMKQLLTERERPALCAYQTILARVKVAH